MDASLHAVGGDRTGAASCRAPKLPAPWFVSPLIGNAALRGLIYFRGRANFFEMLAIASAGSSGTGPKMSKWVVADQALNREKTSKLDS